MVSFHNKARPYYETPFFVSVRVVRGEDPTAASWLLQESCVKGQCWSSSVEGHGGVKPGENNMGIFGEHFGGGKRGEFVSLVFFEYTIYYIMMIYNHWSYMIIYIHVYSNSIGNVNWIQLGYLRFNRVPEGKDTLPTIIFERWAVTFPSQMSTLK